VRYTGEPLRLPIAFKAIPEGVEITFSCSLDPETARDAGNYSGERWNYQWTGGYGSAHFSVSNPEEKKADRLDIKTARLLPDGKTVRLEIADMKPSDQLKIKFSIDAADGEELAQEIHATVHTLRGSQKPVAVR
jgi:hypothetical protein